MAAAPTRAADPSLRRRGRSIGCFTCCVLLPLAAACGAEGGSPDREPTPDERLAAWESEDPDAPLPVALGFGSPIPDSGLVSLLARHRLRPYALYLVAAGTASEERVDRSEASLELVGRSREETLGMLRVALCAQPDRAQAMLEDSRGLGSAQELQRVATLLTHVDRLQSELPDLATGAPMFWGVEAVGSLSDVLAVRDEPLLVSFEPGAWVEVRGGRQLVVPQPTLAHGWAEPEVDSQYPAMGGAALQERIRAVAQGITGCDGVESGGP